jgi:hypothetical protein
VSIRGKGRGVIALKDMPCGTLVVGCKAFAIVPKSGEVTTLRPFDFTGCTEELTKVIVDELQRNPQKTQELYSLWDGQMRRDDSVPDGTIDLERIDRICALNAFATIPVPGRRTEEYPGKHEVLCILPSFFNHSCVPNCAYAIWEDYMTIRNIRPVRKGEELTLMYTYHHDCEERWKSVDKYGFTCNCSLCWEERNDPNLQRRLKIQREIENLPEDEDIEEILRRANEVREACSGQKVKVGLCCALFQLADRFLLAGRKKEAIDCLEEILTCCTDELQMKTHLKFVALGDSEEFRPLILKHLDEAFELFKVIYGLGAEAFERDLEEMFSNTIGSKLAEDWRKLRQG